MQIKLVLMLSETLTEGTIPEEAEALLLIDVDGNEKNVANDISRIDALCRENRCLEDFNYAY